MSSHHTLPERWRQLTHRYSEDQALILSLWRNIERRYREPQRHYHTLTHLAAVFKDIDTAVRVSDTVASETITNDTMASAAIAFAVFYHDIIYRPGSKRNEKASAKLAQRHMTRLGVPRATIDQVSYMIVCTQHHTNPQHEQDTQYFLDADMAILGVDSAAYTRYCLAVRKEFSGTPELLFRRGRKHFIVHTLAQPAIYQSAYFFNTYEQQARVNLSDELQQLSP